MQKTIVRCDKCNKIIKNKNGLFEEINLTFFKYDLDFCSINCLCEYTKNVGRLHELRRKSENDFALN
ncbi:MAG: hypothetical protein ACOCV1_08650 [Bacillota bacterium]